LRFLYSACLVVAWMRDVGLLMWVQWWCSECYTVTATDEFVRGSRTDKWRRRRHANYTDRDLDAELSRCWQCVPVDRQVGRNKKLCKRLLKWSRATKPINQSVNQSLLLCHVGMPRRFTCGSDTELSSDLTDEKGLICRQFLVPDAVHFIYGVSTNFAIVLTLVTQVNCLLCPAPR